MTANEKFVSIRGVVVLLLIFHLSSVNGCSPDPEPMTTEAPETSTMAVKDCPEHVCNDNKKCYTQAQQCDGTMDCDDNTDEDAGHCDMKGMPTFQNASCTDATTETKWDLCIKVIYPNDNEMDYMLLEDGHGFRTYKGEMKKEKISVVFSWPDEDDGEVNATAQFHSMHVATCVDFSIDLTGYGATGKSSCIPDDPMINGTMKYGNSFNDSVLGYETDYASNQQGNALDGNGYEMDLDVYFDDDMVDVYRTAAATKSKLQKVMAYVQEIYEEKDTLQTKIKMKINVIHKSGQRWALPMAAFSRNQGDRRIWNTMGQIAQSSGDKHLYAYITSSKGAVMGGWANLGVLCSGRRASRVGISRYFQGNVIGTARLIAHELGHNLAMQHDFIGSNTANVRRDRNGRPCYGYMDYNGNTNYWSTCNVEYLTRQNKNCLRKLGNGGGGGGGGGGDGGSGCTDNPNYPYCQQFSWACTDARYPWFKNYCNKTCRVC